MQDIINLVQDNPTYNSSWEDFLSADAGRMLIELFSYISDQLATRVDWVANENFIGTSTQKSSVMKILKILGYNFTLPVGAAVGVNIILSSADWDKVKPNGFYLTEGYENGDTNWAPFSLTAKDTKGITRTFELIDYNVITGEYNYETDVPMTESSVSETFYEGQTRVETFTVEDDNNQIFTLTNSSVIENSILVRLVGATSETTLLEVNSFLDPYAQRETYSDGTDIPIPYILNVYENDVVEVEFAPTSLLSLTSRRPTIGDRIRFIYRTGGGVDGNIIRNSINTTRTLFVIPIGGSVTKQIKPTFNNPSAGTGGSEGETIEHASVYAPLTVRTVGKAVTEEDHDILIQSSENVVTSKSYGGHNMPTNLYSIYGQYIRPLEIWNYVIPNNAEGWDVNTIVPSDYHDFQWMTYRKENRFNGVYSFRDGAFNSSVSLDIDDLVGDTTIDWWGDSVYTYWQLMGDSFYDGDSAVAGLTWGATGDSYLFIVNGQEYKIITGDTGDSTYDDLIGLINASINGDSLFAEAHGDTGAMDIRFYMNGDTDVTLSHPSGDTLWATLTSWTGSLGNKGVDGLGDSFTNFLIINPPSAIKTAITNAITGDSYIRIKLSTENDTTQQFKNIPSTVGDSIYGDTYNSSTWRTKENINAYTIGNVDLEDGIDMSSNYKVELSVDGDTFVEINMKSGAVDPEKVRSYEMMYNINRALFESFGYGDSGQGTGDTSYGDSTGLTGVASVVEYGDTAQYLKLTSPKSGDSSLVQIRLLSDDDISEEVFGDFLSGDTGDSFISHGIKGICVITNPNHSLKNRIIYEIGTMNFHPLNTDTAYLHYLKTNNQSLILGRYFYDNYTEGTDVEYRDIAPRIYNSYFTAEGDSAIDTTLSEFDLRFTKGDTRTMSLYIMTDDWPLNQCSSAELIGDTAHGDTVTITTLYNFRVDVDGKGDTTVDVTDGDSAGAYLRSEIVANINNKLQTTYYSEGAPYTTAEYASFKGDSLSITSPTLSNSSSVKLLPPATSDATAFLFAKALGGDSQLFSISGDYFLEYDSTENMMKMTKNSSGSDLPDLDLRIHFIRDRRYEENTSTNPITEEDFRDYFENTKIIALENEFKPTNFSTFDIAGTIHYLSTYTEGQVSTAVEAMLYREYSLINSSGENKRVHEQKVFRSKLLDQLHSVDGVEYVEISYFGKDYTDSSTAVTDYIDCNFDEIIVLSEEVSSGNIPKHGPIFNYRIVT
jgi:hypothetical protein